MKSISINCQNKEFKKKYAFLLNQISQVKNKEPLSSQHRYLKKANATMKNLYRKSEFCENEEFLYWRYCVLENISDLTKALLTSWGTGVLGSALVSLIFNLSSKDNHNASIPPDTLHVLVAVSFAAIVFALGLLIYLTIQLFVNSQRSLTQTLQQNEMAIIRRILIERGIFL